MILKDTAISTTINTMIGLLLLTGLLMIPSAVGAELNLNSISAQISLLQGLLTDYYVALTLNLENIIARLVAIASSIANISTQLTTQQNILFFIIGLINDLTDLVNALRRRSLDDHGRWTLLYTSLYTWSDLMICFDSALFPQNFV